MLVRSTTVYTLVRGRPIAFSVPRAVIMRSGVGSEEYDLECRGTNSSQFSSDLDSRDEEMVRQSSK